MASALAPQLAAKIIDYLRLNKLDVGTHLGAQFFADQFNVSRMPITAAFELLLEQGVLVSQRNRGYFVATSPEDLATPEKQDGDTATLWEDPLYYQLAEDWLTGKMEERISENELMRFYDVSRNRLRKVLQRAAQDLWVERLPGHGWQFQSVMVSPQAYADGYRFRMVIEPAALLEPTFRIDKAALSELGSRQIELLKGGIRRMSRTELFSINSQFHETIIGFSNNPFFVDAVQKIDRVRRLLDFRSTQVASRNRLVKQCSEHLEIIALLEQENMVGAAELLRSHIKEALESKFDLIATAPMSDKLSKEDVAGQQRDDFGENVTEANLA